jgi:hypothetical protein
MEQAPRTRRSSLLGRLSTPLKQAASLLGSTVGLTRSQSANSVGAGPDSPGAGRPGADAGGGKVLTNHTNVRLPPTAGPASGDAGGHDLPAEPRATAQGAPPPVGGRRGDGTAEKAADRGRQTPPRARGAPRKRPTRAARLPPPPPPPRRPWPTAR